MPVDSLSESVCVFAPTVTAEPDCTNIECGRGWRTDTRVPRLSPRSGRNILEQKSAANAEVDGGFRSGVSETTLARFERTVQLDRPRLLSLAQHVVFRREIAEEIVQESLLKAFRALPRFRGDSGMKTWLYAIVRNATIEHLRNQRESFDLSLEHFFDGDGMSVYDPPDLRNNPEENCEMAEMKTILLGEVDGLSPCCKDAFRMCILEEMSQSRAAATVNVSIGKIKSRICRAKRILSNRVRRRAGVAPRVRDQSGDGKG